MSRPKKHEPNIGSLKMADGAWRKVEFTYNAEAKAFYLKDPISKKRFGPYDTAEDARKDGKEFKLDNGARAEGRKPARRFHALKKVVTEPSVIEKAGSLAEPTAH